jgi:hypothetical protein
VPPPEQLAITKDQATCGTGQRPSEALLVAADQGIKNVVVSLVDVSKGKPQPAAPEPPTLTQEKCWFSPRALLVPAESTIDVLNHDNVMHNIHTASQANPVVNKAHWYTYVALVSSGGLHNVQPAYQTRVDPLRFLAGSLVARGGRTCA